MSGYPAEMQESLKRVEASRMRRLDETHARMSLEESQRVLNDFHPDYLEERMRAISVGVSAGQRMPLELADIVEGRPHISPDFDLSRPAVETDVLIVGGGGAGASAALLAQEKGAEVVVTTKPVSYTHLRAHET